VPAQQLLDELAKTAAAELPSVTAPQPVDAAEAVRRAIGVSKRSA
jgi:hypothetical protein